MRTKLRDGERKIFETRAHWITVIKPFKVCRFCGRDLPPAKTS